jgi:hypothetical protein
MLAAILSELAKKCRGCNLKIQHQTSFDLNGLKNGVSKIFKCTLQSMQVFQILMGGMNFRKRSQKNKNPQQREFRNDRLRMAVFFAMLI